MSQKSFFQSFSIIFPRSQFFLYHFASLGSIPFSIAHFRTNTFKVLLCCLTYSLPTSFLHPDKRWYTVSLCSPHNLHLSHSTNPFIFFHAHVSTICLCNTNIDDFFLVSVLHFNQPECSSLYYWVFHFEASSLPNCCLFIFCSSVKIFFSFFPCFFPISVTFSANNYTSFIK